MQNSVDFCLTLTVLFFFLLHQMTPLHLAAKKGGRSNIVNHLVDKGADINIQDTHFGVSETILCILTTVSTVNSSFLSTSIEDTLSMVY